MKTIFGIVTIGFVALMVAIDQKSADNKVNKIAGNRSQSRVLIKISIGWTETGDLKDWIPSREGVVGNDGSFVVTDCDRSIPGHVLSTKRMECPGEIMSQIRKDEANSKQTFADGDNSLFRMIDGALTVYKYELDTRLRYPPGISRLIGLLNEVEMDTRPE